MEPVAPRTRRRSIFAKCKASALRNGFWKSIAQSARRLQRLRQKVVGNLAQSRRRWTLGGISLNGAFPAVMLGMGLRRQSRRLHSHAHLPQRRLRGPSRLRGLTPLSSRSSAALVVGWAAALIDYAMACSCLRDETIALVSVRRRAPAL